MPAPAQLVVGTAGHIDHGKSRLVWALTGIDPDRLPEEKARGMTIDLGFGHTRLADCDVWFVDVPGHERFIRNMVAGATGIDLALLVVAADDSVMPQTREHIELLRLLAIPECFLVLTKLDLVDADWAAAVEDEAVSALAAVGITPTRKVRTSAQSGAGLDELRAALVDAARARSHTAPPAAWFRMPIDRAFSVPGRGTVVTGSVLHGRLERDAELELWPAGRRVRVRDLQTHNEQLGAVSGRMRLAVNLAGVELGEVRRGCELAAPGHLEASNCIEVWLPWLRMPGQELHRRIDVRLHTATRELIAQLQLQDTPTQERVGDLPAILRLAEPLVAALGQRFVLRDVAGQRTLGGGTILRPVARPWSVRRPPHGPGLAILRDGRPEARVLEVFRAAGWRALSDAQLAARAALPDEQSARLTRKTLTAKGALVTLEGAAAQLPIHADLFADVARGVRERIARHLDANPRLAGIARGELPAWMPRNCDARWRQALADRLIAAGRLATIGAFVVPPGHAAALSADDQKLLADILAAFEHSAFQPPAIEELPGCTPKTQRRLRALIDLAVARGQLVRVADGVWLHGARHAELLALVGAEFRARESLTVAELRTLLNSSRKFVVPIAEHLDAIGITRRVGDARKAGPNLIAT